MALGDFSNSMHVRMFQKMQGKKTTRYWKKGLWENRSMLPKMPKNFCISRFFHAPKSLPKNSYLRYPSNWFRNVKIDCSCSNQKGTSTNHFSLFHFFHHYFNLTICLEQLGTRGSQNIYRKLKQKLQPILQAIDNVRSKTYFSNGGQDESDVTQSQIEIGLETLLLLTTQNKNKMIHQIIMKLMENKNYNQILNLKLRDKF